VEVVHTITSLLGAIRAAIGAMLQGIAEPVYIVVGSPAKTLTVACGGAKYYENRLLRALAVATEG
jgi:hypothetical protein